MLRDDTPRRTDIVPLDVPKLSIRGPLALGILAFASFVTAGTYAAQTYMLPQVSRLDASLVNDVIESIVRAPAEARTVEILVKPGDVVESGQKLAQLDTTQLDDRITKLASKAAATRWRLMTIREMVAEARLAKAGKSPGAGSMTLSSGIASLKDEIRNVEQMARMLGLRLAQARQEIETSAIFARVAGRVELLEAPLANGVAEQRGTKGRAIMKLVNEMGPVRVKVMLPAGLLQTVSLGTAARVILSDPQTRKLRAFPARLKFTVRQVAAASGIEAAHAEAIFEIDVPRWQIAKQIDLHLAMNAEVLVETGRQRLSRQLFAIPL